MRTLTKKEVLDAWGESPDAVAANLERFARSARALSSESPNLIDAHPERWVAVYNGTVEASADTVNGVMAKLDELAVPKSEVIIRFLTRKPKNLFF
jgi:hypothetical protein